MFNRYNTPAEYKPASTYVPIPFEELLTAGMMKDKQYADNQATKDAFYTGLKDFTVHPADEQLYQSKIADLDNQLQEVIKNTPDIGSYDFKRQLDTIISSQKRDTDWRQMQYNKAKYQDLLKEYNKAKEEGNVDSNLYEIEDTLNKFNKYGSKGVGFLGDVPISKYVDYNKYLEDLGQGFIKEGNLTGKYNADFTLKSTTSREEIPVAEVANVYGYNFNPSTGRVTLAGIPSKFMNSTAGEQLQRDARYIAAKNGSDPNEVLKALYQQATLPLVAKYSGGITKSDLDLTSLGAKALEDAKDKTDYSVYSAPSQVPSDKRDMTGKVEGWEPTVAGKVIRSYMSSFLKAVNWLSPIEYTRIDTSKTGDRIEQLVKDTMGDNKKKGEDFTAIERMITTANPALKNNPRELQKQVESYIEDFYSRGNKMPVTLTISPKEKDRQAKVWFGGAADNGVINASALSGAAINQKVFNPEDPSSTKTLGELAKKSNTIEYIGPLKNNNLYAPGLHEIVVDGNTYYMAGTNEDELNNMFEFKLYDYERHASGLGNWFPVSGTNKEVRSIKYINPATKQEEVRLQYKPKGADNSKAKSTGPVSPDDNLFDFYSKNVHPILKK